MSSVLYLNERKKEIIVDDIRAILTKIRVKIGAKSDKEMCKILGVAYGTLDNWKQRKQIPPKRILEFATKLNIPLEYLTNSNSFLNNTNSVIVNGANNGSIVNTHQVKVSDELMEFVELFKEYGSAALLKKWTKELKNTKESMKE